MTVREITIVRKAPQAPDARRVPATANALHALKVKLSSGQAVWFGSDERVQSMLPPGSVWINALIAKGSLPTITISPGFKTGSGRISGAGYAILDDQDEFGDWLASKHINQQEVTNRTIEQYSFGPDDDFGSDPRRYLQYTFQIKSISRTVSGVYRLRCQDIQRDLDVQILPERKLRLAASISATSGLIPLTLDLDEDVSNHDYRTVHAPDYDQDPGLTIGYSWLKSGDKQEIYSYTGFATTSAGGKIVRAHKVHRRGLFGTSAQEWTVGATEEDDNKQEIIHYPYYEGEPLAILQGLVTGKFPDGRALLDGDHGGLSAIDGIDVLSLAAASSDKRRVLRGIYKVNLKKFIEDEILKFQPGVLIPGRDGRLRYQARAVYGETTPLATIDETNCYLKSVGPYTLDTDLIKAVTSISWDYNPVVGEFLKESYWSDPVAVAAHKAAGTESYESKLISSSRATEPEIKRFAGVLYDRHANGIPRLPLDVTPEQWWVPVGSPVRIKLRVKDYVNGSGLVRDIDRVMMIVGSTHNQSKSKMTWQLAGTIDRATDLFAARPALSEEAYLEGAKLLSEAPGVIVRPDGHFGGTPVLAKGQKYAHIGPATLDADFSPIWTGSGSGFEFWVRGILLIAANIDLAGEGRAGGAAGEAGSLNLFDPVPGGAFDCRDRWFHGRISGSDGDNNVVTGAVYVNQRTITSTPPADYGTAPKSSVRLSLSANDGRLQGLYSDLSGSGGHGGGKSYSRGYLGNGGGPLIGQAVNYTEADGGAGANGGGDCTLVSFPGSDFIGSGSVNTSGDDAPYAGLWTPAGGSSDTELARASGSPGMPGGLQWAIDGAGTRPTITSGNFIANVGAVTLAGVTAPENPVNDKNGRHDTYHSRYLPVASQSLWTAAHDVQHIPAAAAVQEDTIPGVFGSLAISRQRDGAIKLITTNSSTVPPSDGLPGDMAIWDVALAGTNPEPPAWIMDDSFTWQPIDWLTAPTDYATLLFINRNYGGTESILSPTRPVGKPAGTHWLNESDGTEWILGETEADDVLFRDKGVPVGIELLNNGNFAEGDRDYIFTRDADLQPVNVLNQLATQIVDAFISHSEIEGEYVPAQSGVAVPEAPGPVQSMQVFVLSDTEARIIWQQGSDTTGVVSQEVIIDGTDIRESVGSPYLVTDLTPGQTYLFGVRNISAAGGVSAVVDRSVQMTDGAAPVGQRGIVLSDQGRTVAGSAYENDASVVIASGRTINLTLNDSTVIGPETVGANGAFSFTVSSAHDANLNKTATIYTNNGSDATKSTITFTYEL